MVFDSHSTKAPSCSTGTIAFGLSARNSAVCVERKPAPHSSWSTASCISAHSHSNLRTLIDDDLPSSLSMKDHLSVQGSVAHRRRLATDHACLRSDLSWPVDTRA